MNGTEDNPADEVSEEEFYLSQDELHDEPAPRAWEDIAADEAGVPRFGEI